MINARPDPFAVWVGDAILTALRNAGWLVPRALPQRPAPVQTKDDDLPRGVTRKRMAHRTIVRAMLCCSWPGQKITITLGTLTDTPGNIARLERMWQAARDCYQDGGTIADIKAAAQQAGED